MCQRCVTSCVCGQCCCTCAVVSKDHVITGEGMESTMATNHYGHFLLTALLMPLLEKVRSPRTATGQRSEPARPHPPTPSHL